MLHTESSPTSSHLTLLTLARPMPVAKLTSSGGLSVFSFLWCFFRLPETKHRTFEEIDYLFEHKVPTRKFKGYVIEEDNLRHNLEEE
ncbi:hypothetical protein F5884DRAFT_812096 [Xylogone sp. PMI_703]|nr:hypothetical protein F5884DRAFT_812096 [Xylogone sp. PMI_703]